MYTLRNIARRGTMLAGAGALAFASLASGSSAFADALNPLTHRSLTLSSSSPGWDYLDGSGNSTYAPPNSGTNGQKSGNTFSFNVSTDSNADATKTLKAFTFQYCTTSAGNCTAPGNDNYVGTAGSYTGRDTNATDLPLKKSDLEVVTSTPTEIDSSAFGSDIDASTGNVKAVPAANGSANFVVMTENGGTWSYQGGWTMAASNVETGTVAAGTATGKNNFITLTNSTGIQPHAGDGVKIIFFATNTNYITNPGQGAFFVKINDYNSDTTQDAAHLVDGGVTVANVMNQSIQITTKVLETMDFSVGTVDPVTLNDTQLAAASNTLSSHGLCDPILPSMDKTSTTVNTLDLGDQNAENSLSTSVTYSTHSYWRLSSNSSAGATVYYSGATLHDTENDYINPIGLTAKNPSRGTPQFGLALDNGTIASNYNSGTSTYTGVFPVDYTTEEANNLVYENGADKTATQGVDPSYTSDISTAGLTAAAHPKPQLAPLIPEANYDNGAGNVNPDSGLGGTLKGDGYTLGNTASFAFDPNSNLIPTPLASEASQVVDCVTGKVRYIANIAATTPAGIYTTKINYIAAPQY